MTTEQTDTLIAVLCTFARSEVKNLVQEWTSCCCHVFAVKGVNFYGPCSEFIVSGSDCGNVYLWHRDTEKIVNFFHADDGGVVSFELIFPLIMFTMEADLDY